MKRLHVHVSVDNLADSIRFYSSLFAHQPTVEKTDYAKWMLDDPCVNFAISKRGHQLGLNHLGMQVESDAELSQMQERIEALQPGAKKEEGAACCYAKSDKYWLTDPQGVVWETFHSLDTIPVFGDDHAGKTEEACCIPLAAPNKVDSEVSKKAAAPCCVPAENAKGAACCG
jgi:hypothetical protein